MLILLVSAALCAPVPTVLSNVLGGVAITGLATAAALGITAAVTGGPSARPGYDPQDFRNNGIYPNGGYPNGGYPNGGYSNGGYPNGGYPSQYQGYNQPQQYAQVY